MPPSTPPTLATIPPEIILIIISHLRYDSVIKLSRTSRVFHFLTLSIPKAVLHPILLAAETEGWAGRQWLYACSRCLRLRRNGEFSQRMSYEDGRHRGGVWAKERKCYECEAEAFHD